jgi:hypothetical protein
MIVHRHRQVLIAAFAIGVSCACGGGGSGAGSASSATGSSPTGASGAEDTAAEGNASGGTGAASPSEVLTGAATGTLQPFLIGVSRTAQGADPGYEVLTVEFGFQAGQAPQQVAWPDGGTITIAEGRDYDAKVEIRDKAGTANSFGPAWFSDGYGTNFAHAPIPPGIPFCGLLPGVTEGDENAFIVHLYAFTQIPQGTTPDTLSLNGYSPGLDLSNPPSDPAAPCRVDASKLTTPVGQAAAFSTSTGQSGALTVTKPPTRIEIPIGTTGSPPQVLTAHGLAVPFLLANQSNLDPLNTDLVMYSVDPNGVLGYPVDCQKPGSNAAISSLGPGQSGSRLICFPADDNPIGVIAVIQDADQPSVVGTFTLGG